jgi:hypothetical protein
MDCRAALAATSSVMASEARPSIFAVRDDGLPRFARSDEIWSVQFKELLPQAQLLGQTRLTVWGFKIYDAQLWAAPGFNAERYANQPLALELAYLRDFDAADIADRSIKEMRRSATISDAQARQWRLDMQRVFPNVKVGDRIMGVHRPGVGASFWVNGKAGGEILDAEFSKLFFGIWLSPKTSEPAMRTALVGGAGS